MRARIGQAQGGRQVAFADFLPQARLNYRHIDGTTTFAFLASRSLSIATACQCCADAVANKVAVSEAAAGHAAPQSTP